MGDMYSANSETPLAEPATIWAVFEEPVMRLDAVLTLPAGAEPTIQDLADAGLDTGHVTTSDWIDEDQRWVFHDPDQPDADVWQARPVLLHAPAVEWLMRPMEVETVDETFPAVHVTTRGSSLPHIFYVPTDDEFSPELVASILARLGLSAAKNRGTRTGRVVLVEQAPPPADEFTDLVTGVLGQLGYVLDLDVPEHERHSVKSWPADERDLYRELNRQSPFDYAYAKVERLRAAKLAEALRDAMGRIAEGR